MINFIMCGIMIACTYVNIMTKRYELAAFTAIAAVVNFYVGSLL